MEDIIKEAMSILDEKNMINASVNEAVKTFSENHDLDPKAVRSYDRYRSTHGRGWGGDCLEKSEDKILHPDTVAAAFRKVRDIIEVFAAVGCTDELKEYLDVMERDGVKIEITIPTRADVDGIGSHHRLVKGYMEEVWDKDAIVSDVLAKRAEEDGIAPAGKFGKYVSMQYRINYGKGKTDKMSEQIDHEKDLTLMYHDALETL